MTDEIRFDHDVLESGLSGVQDTLNSLINRAEDDSNDSSGLDADTVDALRRAVEATTSEMRGGDEDAETARSASRSAEQIAEAVAQEIQRVAEAGPETGLSSAGGGGTAAPASTGVAQAAAQAHQSAMAQAQAAQMQQAQQSQLQMAQYQQMQQAQMAAARQQVMAQQAAQQAIQQSALATAQGQTTGGSLVDKLGGAAGGDVDKEAIREAIYEALKEQDEAVSGAEDGERGVIDDSQIFGDESSGRAIELAQEFAAEGLPYVWGGGHGTEPGPTGGGLDCSGLTRDFIWKWKGIDINGTSSTMATMGVAVPEGEQQPGDLWFPYDSGTPPGHVGVYIGNGQVLEAQTTGTNVGIFDERPGFFRRIE